jgi:hypothetical protein
MVISIIGLVLFIFLFDLDKKMPQIRKDLDERRAAAAAVAEEA